MKTIFRKKFWNAGRRRGRCGSKGHTMALLVFPQHMSGGYCWVRGAVHEGREQCTDRRGFGALALPLLHVCRVLTSLRKLEKKQIFGLFSSNYCGKEVSGAVLQQRRCYEDEMLVFFFFILVTSCCAISSAAFRFEVSRLLYREGVNHRQGEMCLPAGIQAGQRLPTAGHLESILLLGAESLLTCLARGSAAESETENVPATPCGYYCCYCARAAVKPRVPARGCSAREREALGRRSAPLHSLLRRPQCRGVPRGRDGVTFA